MSEFKKFEEKRKASLMETIGSTFWLGLEDLIHTMGFGKGEKPSQDSKGDQISHGLDKFETRHIHKAK